MGVDERGRKVVGRYKSYLRKVRSRGSDYQSPDEDVLVRAPAEKTRAEVPDEDDSDVD